MDCSTRERRTSQRMFSMVATLGLMAGLVGFGAPSAQAVVPGTNGRIVFARETCTPTCMYTIVAADANDTNETLLAGPYPREAYDDHLLANWSPDGKSVIFMVNQGLWQVSADGTGLHEVFESPPGTAVDDGPVFTPDGTHIVFTRCCDQSLTFGYALWMISSDGTGLKDLTKEPPTTIDGDGPADTEPQVSPDGKHIAFNRCFPDQPCVIATVNINGSHLRQLTDNSLFQAIHPNWSPDSKRIVFEMQSNGASDIATMNADGSGLRRLTFNTPGKGFSRSPCYSPDGSKILFQHGPSTGGIDLFTMNPDGGGVAQVTRTPTSERDPEWAVA